MGIFKDKDIIKEKNNGFGVKLNFFSQKFNSSSPVQFFMCVFLCTLFIHFCIYLFNHFMYNTTDTNFTDTNIIRFIIEISLGFWGGYSFFSTSYTKNEIDLHKNILTFKNKYKQKKIKVNEIENIGFNAVVETKTIDFNSNSFYVFAELKGKKYKLHKGYITKKQAEHIINRINL